MPKGRRGGRGRGRGSRGPVPVSAGAISRIGYDEQIKKDITSAMTRHPPHLRGKEIGLWYSQQSRARQERSLEEEGIRSMGTVIIPSGRAKHLRSFLDSLPPIRLCEIQTGQGLSNYSHLPNSSFKRTFLDIIKTNSVIDVKEPEQNPVLDLQLYKDCANMLSSPRYNSMRCARERLPAYQMRSSIMDMVHNNQIVIISGETGCGKTTQVPQFILDDFLVNKKGSICKIICSQPRRISAIAVAERVADERDEPLGRSIGYQIRLENKFPRHRGSITFCTTGVILKHMEGNIGLEGVSHLILDEIHERDVLGDFIITLVKKVLRTRKDLKVILMSATLNAEKFAAYFHVDSILTIPGFTFDVEEFYLEDVLLRTGYKFPENGHKPRDGRNFHRGNRGQNKDENKDFVDMIMPHARRLEDLKLYPKHVCRELMKEASEESTIELAIALIQDICNKKDEGDGAILVFLTGYGDISKANELMEESGNFPRSQYLIIPLHSQMPTTQQKIVFSAPPAGLRKIILSTNIAETSITIDDVEFVIDCGKIKVSDFNSDTNEDILKPQWVSQANASQRRGRAGRVKPGKCFHLFSQVRQMMLEQFQKPELLRKRLDDVILMVKLLKLGSAADFLSTCPDPPEIENIEASILFLKRLNALDDDEVLTPLGYHLARLPVSPQMGKMMLLGSVFSCINPIVNIASALDFKDAFLMPLGKEDQCRKKKRELGEDGNSDHLLFHMTMDKYERVYDKRQFCWEYYLSPQTMSQLVKMKQQFVNILCDLNFLQGTDPKSMQENVNSHNRSLIKSIICASLYPNVFINQTRMANRQSYSKFYTLDHKRLEIHPKSILMRNESYGSPFLVYYRKVRSTSDFIHDASVVHTLPLIFFGDKFKILHDSGNTYFSINDNLKFKTSDDTARIIDELRSRLNHFLEMKACQPASVNWHNNDEIGVLKAILDLITIEDEGYDVDDFD